MTLYIKGTDTVVIGTRETLWGIANASGLSDDGKIVWSGQTDIEWNDQETVIENGLPVWIGEDGCEYRNVEVEDRREDGTVVAFAPFENDDLDELADLLNRVVAKATVILANKPGPSIVGCVEVALRHATNCATGVEKVRAMLRRPEKKEEVFFVQS